jgi:hypothetical protein
MLDTLLGLVPILFLLLLIAASIYILAYGETDERRCIVTAVVSSIATWLAANDGPAWYRGEIGIFVVDVATLIAFIVIMARSTRFWPLWITALQTIAVMTHVARFLKPQTVPTAYAVAEQLWAYVVILILIVCVRQQQSRNASMNSPNS